MRLNDARSTKRGSPRSRRTLSALPLLALVATVVAGCSGSQSTPLPTTPKAAATTAATSAPPSGGATTAPSATPIATATPTPTAAPTPTATPTPTAAPTLAAQPACAGQTTGATNATVTETLMTAGGTLCIPAFGGFGGSIVYPPVSSSISVTLASSTTNDAGFPALAAGTPIYYLQLALSGATSFGTGAPAGGGLSSTSTAIVPGQHYTIYGAASIGGLSLPLTPCQTTATAGAGGTGVISGLGTVLNGASVPLAAMGVLEIYPISSSAGPC